MKNIDLVKHVTELTGGMDHHAVWSDMRRQTHNELSSKGYKLMHDDEEKSIYHHPDLGYHEVMNK